MSGDLRKQKLLDLDGLTTVRGRHPKNTIVHCHGVFDVLHAGHLAYFESAKTFGDLLVVTITSDEYVNKGPGRPYFNSAVRANMLAALEIVDYVAVSKFPTATTVLEALKPHFYVKGPDYKNKSDDMTGGIYAEEAAVEKHGGRLVFTDDQTFSSSALINKFFTPWTDDQMRVIELVRQAGGFDKIESVLNRLGSEHVNVIGEPIVDTYVFCNPENISSKSPSVSAKYLYEENYAGGALAIANHLSDFVKDVTLITTHGNEPYFQQLLADKIDRRVTVDAQILPNFPTPRKTRYIAADKSQRIFELTDLRSDQWQQHSSKEFCALIARQKSKDRATILADFGHGLFEGPVLESVAAMQGFMGLNVQTNSSNFGFNSFIKHRKFSFLSVDIREAQLAYHDRMTPVLELAHQIRADLKKHGAGFAMTRGPQGAVYFPADGSPEIESPAFADMVVDATGAGDAFFAMTALLVKVGCPPVMIPFIGNVFAGLKTRIIGNKASVSRAQLTKAIAAILK